MYFLKLLDLLVQPVLHLQQMIFGGTKEEDSVFQQGRGHGLILSDSGE